MDDATKREIERLRGVGLTLTRQRDRLLRKIDIDEQADENALQGAGASPKQLEEVRRNHAHRRNNVEDIIQDKLDDIDARIADLKEGKARPRQPSSMTSVELRALLNAKLQDRENAVREHARAHNEEVGRMRAANESEDAIAEVSREFYARADMIEAAHRDRILEAVEDLSSIGVEVDDPLV